MPVPARSLERTGATVLVFDDATTACRVAADRIAQAIQEAIAARGRAVLGLATGGTPVPVYGRLVELHRAGEVSFRDVSTFNLDEYYPISPLDPNSYRTYMQRHLFDHVDLAPNRAHVLDGTVPRAFADEACAAFDRWIAAEGGLDLQLLGIGRNGHIGFNEPSDRPVAETAALPTRRAELHPVTLEDAARDFGGRIEAVPREALTVGIGPILAARSILILAFGAGKAPAVARSLEGPVTSQVPASLLQTIAPRVTWLLDEAAAAELSAS